MFEKYFNVTGNVFIHKIKKEELIFFNVIFLKRSNIKQSLLDFYKKLSLFALWKFKTSAPFSKTIVIRL